jgi:hypothetical protein
VSGASYAQTASGGSDLDPITGRPMGTAARQSVTNAAPVVERPVERFGHLHQFELRVGAFEGYRLAVRYQVPSTPCGASPETFCHDRSPVVLDAAAGFGVTESVEIEARFRTGEPDFNYQGVLPLAAGVGVRLYGSDTLKLKWVFGGAIFADFTSPPAGTQWQTDILVRAEGGLHYDVVREFGFYIQVGATFGFLRSLALTVDGGVGVQLRLP